MERQRSRSMSASQTLVEVMNLMECPICLEYFSGSIYMCETGHNVCSTCQKKIQDKKCPICKKKIISQRNFGLEAIAEKMRKTSHCPYKKFGCQFNGNINGIELHEKSCKFRQYNCLISTEKFGKCNWKGSVFQLMSHFQQQHPQHTIIQPEKKIRIMNSLYVGYRNLQLLHVNDKLFLFNIIIDSITEISKWVIQYVGDESEAQKWRYHFLISGKGKYIEVREICKSTDNKLSRDLYEEGHCMCIPLNVLKNFVDGDGFLTYKILIRPIDSEVKTHSGFIKNQNPNIKSVAKKLGGLSKSTTSLNFLG